MSTNTKPSSSVASGKRHHDHPHLSGNKIPKRANGISMFKKAKNTHIKNSVITTNVNVSSDDPTRDLLKKLYDQVAQNAILNTGGRADEVRCYPGTREEVIGLLERWMDGTDDSTHNMMWLSGPAGAGKSAIMQTIIERCKERGVQTASFFFFRADPTRSTAQPLIATLLYQIFKISPPVRQAVADILSDDPLLFGASIQDQFSQLLSSPLQKFPPLHQPPARRPIVLLIDGLDEYDSDKKTPQRQILQALDYLLRQDNCPFLVLVASRAEPHITMAVKELTSPVKSIFLDDQYQPERDIRAFVTEEFRRIKRSHHLAHTLGDNWPSEEDAEAIIKKSSGQFIFAATVMRYIANSSASPKLSLERVQSIAPIKTNSPFAHLDAIYTYILSRAEDWEAVKDLFSTKLLSDLMNVEHYQLPLASVLHAYDPRYVPELLHSSVSDLAAILKFDGDTLVFYHASFPDFLKDQSRAKEYYTDIHAFGAEILPKCWANVLESFEKVKDRRRDGSEFSTSSPRPMRSPTWSLRDRGLFNDSLLHSIHRLFYPRDIKTYKKILRQSVSAYFKGSLGMHLSNIDMETRSLPYFTLYHHIYRRKHRITSSLKGLFRIK